MKRKPRKWVSGRKEPGSEKVKNLRGSCWHFGFCFVLWSWHRKENVSRIWEGGLWKPRFGFYLSAGGATGSVWGGGYGEINPFIRILECICGMSMSGERHTQSVDSWSSQGLRQFEPELGMWKERVDVSKNRLVLRMPSVELEGLPGKRAAFWHSSSDLKQKQVLTVSYYVCFS